MEIEHNLRHSDIIIIIAQSLITPSDMLHLIFGTIFLHHSEFLIQIINPPLSDLHLNIPV